jgi:hypothetical protein
LGNTWYSLALCVAQFAAGDNCAIADELHATTSRTHHETVRDIRDFPQDYINAKIE